MNVLFVRILDAIDHVDINLYHKMEDDYYDDMSDFVRNHINVTLLLVLE